MYEKLNPFFKRNLSNSVRFQKSRTCDPELRTLGLKERPLRLLRVRSEEFGPLGTTVECVSPLFIMSYQQNSTTENLTEQCVVMGFLIRSENLRFVLP